MTNSIKTRTITRFAPSPTGYLHLGGARTALFNWIFAKKFDGKFLLRIEDTDKSRLNKKALSAIFEGLKWLGINWDDDVIYQSNRNKEYRAVVEKLIKEGKAYRCYSTKEEIDAYKNKLLKLGKTTKFVSPWREKSADYKKNDIYVVRLKVPETGRIKIKDYVQGDVTWNCKDLDDLILLRSDGSATYNLAAVVDDNYFNITDVIRGDDHLTNTARQKLIYCALNWNPPKFSHIPLIHGFDGKKMSKRHGAVGVNSYIEQGIKSSALVRYLCQLGLGIISWFIVFIPFLLMTLVVAILLLMFGLDPATGKIKILDNKKNHKHHKGHHHHKGEHHGRGSTRKKEEAENENNVMDYYNSGAALGGGGGGVSGKNHVIDENETKKDKSDRILKKSLLGINSITK